jgi:peptidyl-prolyl cis-trans isomerase C
MKSASPKSLGRAGLFVFLGIFYVLVGCTFGDSKIAAMPVVQVNDQKLTAKEFSEKLARRLKAFDALAAKDPGNVHRAKEEILKNFILQALTDNYAKKNGISISDSELEDEISKFRAGYPDDLSFRRVLAEENLSFSDWKEELRQTLLYRKVFKNITTGAAAPTNSEIQQYYDQHRDLFRRRERIYLRQIVVDDLTKAQQIRDELKKKDFAQVAKKVSVAPEAKQGGLVGWIEKGSVDIFDKAFSLPIGGMSPVLESGYGYHIFKVERKAPAGFASLEEVRPLIVDSLRGQKEQALFSKWLDQQIRASHVLRDNALIDSISVETRGKK